MKIYLETHGCTFNQADTDIMANILAKKYDIVYDVEEADVIILNTCYVKLPTEQKMITKIRKYKTEFPDKKLIIGGCMVEVDERDLKNLLVMIAGLDHINLIKWMRWLKKQ